MRQEGGPTDTNAVVQVLLRERVRVSAAVVAVVRDAHSADDVFQQVVLAALQCQEKFRGPDHLVAWALRAARHRAIDLARRRHDLPLDGAALDALDRHWEGLPAGAPAARVEALRRCLARLPAGAREVLRLRYEADLPCGQVAARLRLSVAAVYQALSRVHRRLRECVDRQLAQADGPPHTPPRGEFVP